MLLDIIEMRDFDLSSYPEIAKFVSILDRTDYIKIKQELSLFKSELYTTSYNEVLEALGLDVCDVKYNPSKYIHGVYHVEKVFLYCYLIVKMYNMKVSEDKEIPDEFIKILFYAAFYHDIGRLDNSENKLHGFNSARAFHELFKDESFFVEDKRRIYLAECLMDLHSLKDYDSDSKIIGEILYSNDENWEDLYLIRDYAKNYFDMLAVILKDADALDRKRFGEWTRASLDPKYLRTSEAKSLVGFADELNRLYYEIQKNNFKECNMSLLEKKDCFHSIGFDFFKIKSILTHGILSQEELKKRNIMTPRNFPGGNFDRWISVVDISLYPNLFHSDGARKKYAASEFTHQGITFYMHDVPLINPCEGRDKEQALEEGLPWNKSGYVDEKFAKDIIPSENILGLFIPYSALEKDVRVLNYIYESTNMDIVRNRVLYYKRYTYVDDNDESCIVLDRLLNEYEELIIKELGMPRGYENRREYFLESARIMKRINAIVGNWVYNYYRGILEDDVSIKNIIEYELSQMKDMEFTAIGSKDKSEKEMFYMIKKVKEKVLNMQEL